MFGKPQTIIVRRILILFLSLPICLLSWAYGDIQPTRDTNINWQAVWQSFFFGVLFTMLFRFLNKKSKTVDQRSNAGLPLTGWVLFLGFNLVARIIIQTYFFCTAGYFSVSIWNQMLQAGGTKFQFIFIAELFLSLFSLSGTAALLYWFLGRRDIFPAMFIYYVGFYVIATFILLIIYYDVSMPAGMRSIRHNSILQIFRILYAIAWFTYLLNSKQVKQTFVYPPDR
jgi:hypothetical protein